MPFESGTFVGLPIPSPPQRRLDDIEDALNDLTAPLINVQLYGAAGDGATDDTAAIQAACDALTNGGTLYFPATANYYLVSDSITPLANTRLLGDGSNSIIRCPASGWTLSSTAHYGIINVFHVDNVEIAGLHIYGTKTQDIGHTPKLIYLEQASYINIHDNFLENSAFEGIWEGGDITLTTQIIVRNNYIANVGWPADTFVGLPAIQMNATEAVIDGNYLTDVGVGIGASGDKTTVVNNHINGITTVGIGTGDGGGMSAIVIANNTIEFIGNTTRVMVGILLDSPAAGTSNMVLVDGNFVKFTSVSGHSNNGIYGSTSLYNTITNNVVEMTTEGIGINVQASDPPNFAYIGNNTVRGIDEVLFTGIAVATNGVAGTTINCVSAGNRVVGGFAAANSFAYDFNQNGGGTCNATNIGDFSDGGWVRNNSFFDASGTFNNVPYFTGVGGTGNAMVLAQSFLCAVPTTSYPSLNLPTGSAPSSPNDGDVWREDNTNTGLKIRVNGVTKTITLS